MNECTVIIIGGGISGLHTALELAKRGVSFKLFEARERFGGRIYLPTSKKLNHAFDIGPSWFWSGQTNIEKLILDLGLQNNVFSQYASGHALYEPLDKPLVRGVQGISMQGSYRITGGLNAITQTIQKRITELSKDSLQLNSKVKSVLKQKEEKILVQLHNGNEYLTHKVILALPPRVALETIQFRPNFSQARTQELNNVATWMAGHAKVVIVYENTFWRKNGYSGDAFSQRGPLGEIHDASSYDESIAALFGFLALQPKLRNISHNNLNQLIIQQLIRLYGEQAAKPIDILYKNWSEDPFTATSYDQEIQNHHPSNFWNTRTEVSFDNNLVWSGSESAQGQFNGYIEGALSASLYALQVLNFTA